MWRMGPRTRASTPSGGGSTSDGRRRPDQPLRGIRRGRPGRRARAFDQLSRPAPRLENAASRRTSAWRTSPPATGMRWREDWRRYVDRRSPAGRERRSPTRSRRRDRRICGDSPTWAHAHNVDAIATRGDRLVLCRFRSSGRDQRPEEFYSEVLGVFEINADSGSRRTSCSTSTTIDAAVEELDARYLAGEAAAIRAPGRSSSADLRGDQPTRAPATTPDCGHYRSPAGRAIAAGDMVA